MKMKIDTIMSTVISVVYAHSSYLCMHVRMNAFWQNKKLNGECPCDVLNVLTYLQTWNIYKYIHINTKWTRIPSTSVHIEI